MLWAEGPDELWIYGFDGFQIHQIRNLRILEWIWKLFSGICMEFVIVWILEIRTVRISKIHTITNSI